MDKIQIVCPNCRSRLSVMNQPDVMDKILACPICKFKAKVSIYQGGAAAQGGMGPSDIPTQPSSDMLSMSMDAGQLRIVQTGQIIELRKGEQTLGRLADTSKADVKIGSERYSDPYMSRLHVNIEVAITPAGIQHRLKEIGSKNIIQLNGQDIHRGDIIILHFGDKITLGKTDLVLEETDDEATRIV